MARFGDDDTNYKAMLEILRLRIKYASGPFDWKKHNIEFIPKIFEPFMDNYSAEEKKLVAGHLAWRIAEEYGFGGTEKASKLVKKYAENYVRTLGKYITDYSVWKNLTEKMGIINYRNPPENEVGVSKIDQARSKAVRFFQKIDDIRQPEASDYVDTDEYNMACIATKLTKDTYVRSMLDSISNCIDKSGDPKAKALLAAYGYNEAVARGLSKNNELDNGMVDLFVKVINKHNYDTKDVDKLLQQFSEEDDRTKGVKVAIKQKLSISTKNNANKGKEFYTPNIYGQMRLRF